MQFDHGVLKKIRLEDLYVFKLLCELENYSKVAETIGKSQGTISIEINRLEENLGVTLIERTSKTFRITKFGSIFLDFCEETLKNYEGVLHKLEEKSGEISGILHIASSSIPGEYIIPAQIRKFKEKHPKMDFNISISNSSRAYDDLIDEKVEFAAVGFRITQKKRELIEFIKIGEDELHFVADPNHELFDRDRIVMSDLYNYPFVLRETGSATRKSFELSDYYNENIKVRLSLDSNQSILTALRDSDYISILSKFALKRFISSNSDQSPRNLKILEPADFEPIRREFYLLKLRNKDLSRSARLFWDFAKNGAD